MKRHIASRLLFLATCLAAPAAWAGTDIVKCVDPAGHVTLTDEPCRTDSETVLLPASANRPAADGEPAPIPAAVGVTRIVTTEDIVAPARPVAARHDNWARRAAPGRALARDVATLKAARASLQLMDDGRQARLARLN